MRLQDKVILVTGSTMGIGEAIARRVVREGGRVLVHGLEREEGERVAGDLGDAAALHLDDLADTAAPARIVDAAIEAFGHLDGLVNNAALVVRGKIDNTDAAFFDHVMQVNVRAPFLLIKTALPFLETTRGSVVNIGSVNAYCGEENLLPYSVSKGALMTLSRNLGDTLHRRGVRVNQVNPGWVLTENEKRRKQDEGMDDDWPSHLPREFAPAGRILDPDEIAAAAVFFLSDECGPISGSVLDCEQYPFIGRNPPKC